MRISVVIPTFNRRGVLARTLPPLFAQHFPRDKYEIIVVADGCTDGTAEFVRGLRPACRLRVIEQPNRGQGMARFAGIQAATGEIILSMDDDILAEPLLLRQHSDAHGAGGARVAFGSVSLTADSPGIAARHMRRYFDAYYARFERSGAAENQPSGFDPNTSAPRSLLTSCIKPDPQFSYNGEGADAGMQLARAGAEFRYLRNANTRQIYTKSAADLAADHARVGRTMVRLSRKYPEWREKSPFHRSFGPVATTLRRLVSTTQFPPDSALAALCGIGGGEEILVPGTLRLLRMRLALQTYRAAVRAAGSWKELMRICGPDPSAAAVSAEFAVRCVSAGAAQ